MYQLKSVDNVYTYAMTKLLLPYFEKFGIEFQISAVPLFLQLALDACDGISDTTDVPLRWWVIFPQKH